MVDDRVTDGRRIGQLLASELDGRDDGPLSALSVVDADPDAEPSANGTVVYGVARDGDRFADVLLHPERVTVRLRTDDPAAVVDAVRGPALTVRRPEPADGPESDNASPEPARSTDRGVDPAVVVLDVTAGAAVKRCVDALVAGLR